MPFNWSKVCSQKTDNIPQSQDSLVSLLKLVFVLQVDRFYFKCNFVYNFHTPVY